MVKRIIFIIFLVLLIASRPIFVSADKFTGSGISTTATITSTKYTKVSWSSTPENEYAIFNAHVYREGESTYLQNFNGLNGTTYIYEPGTFYFSVLSASLDWTIITEDTDGEYLSSGETIIGSANHKSKLFEVYGQTTFTWNYVAQSDLDIFSVYVYSVESKIYSSVFTGVNGTSSFYEVGTFYLYILAGSIISYNITIDIVQPNLTDNGSTENSIINEIIINPLMLLLLPMLPSFTSKIRKNN